MQIVGNKIQPSQSTPSKPPKAHESSPPTYEITRTLPSDTWQRTEVIHDTDAIFKQQQFSERSKQHDPEIVEAFGTATPFSGDALLHYAGDPPADAPKRTAVLLVHGANKTGNFYWDPSEDGSNKGLAQHLRDDGHPTYAITFANNQDDNFLQAEQIANAIAQIKKETGAEKVDLVAHSKGGVAARIYTSGVRKEGVESTPYQGDVRRLVLAGSPNKGVDYIFRHPSANMALLQDSDSPLLNAPTSWEKRGVFPLFADVSDSGYSDKGHDYFPGQDQLLADLSKEHPLSPIEPDWATTYTGGIGFQSVSKGIQYYIEQGENVIARLNEHAPDKSIEVALLAGNSASIPGILNEYTGVSDGLVFTDSALSMPKGTNVVAKEVLPLHHKALIADESGQDWITHALDDESPKSASSDQIAKVEQHFDAKKAEKRAAATIEQLTALADKKKNGEFLLAATI